ncbi:MAG: type II toxin-antitoxin system RelE/ParE family toxin [Planctomycetota bacterium]
MTYRVTYTREFLQDIKRHNDYLIGEGAGIETVASWYAKVFERLDSLNELPHRYPVDERQTDLNGCETRKLNYQGYLVYYKVDEDRRSVFLLKFKHGASRR